MPGKGFVLDGKKKVRASKLTNIYCLFLYIQTNVHNAPFQRNMGEDQSRANTSTFHMDHLRYPSQWAHPYFSLQVKNPTKKDLFSHG